MALRTPTIPRDCEKCSAKILNREFLICSLCNVTYDLNCGNVSIARFLRMTRDHKTAWACKSCLAQKNKTTNTRSTATSQIKKTYGITNKDVNNITIRKPKVVSKLSVDDNISVNDTTDELEYTSVCDSSISFTRTPKQIDQGIKQLKLDNDELTKQLVKAKEEISGLIQTNTLLKEKLQAFESHKKELDCNCTQNINHIQDPLEKTLENSNTEDENGTMLQRPIKKKKKIKKTKRFSKTRKYQEKTDTETYGDSEDIDMNLNTPRNKLNILEKTEAKPKILIVGDQSCRYLAASLISLREKHKNVKNYQIACLMYPNAPGYIKHAIDTLNTFLITLKYQSKI